MIKFEKTIDLSQFSQATIDTATELTANPMNAIVSFNASLKFSEINKPVKIETPEEAMTIEELFTSFGLFNSLEGPATTELTE